MSEAPGSLVYVSDGMPGIRRLRRGGGFQYRRPDGTPLHDACTVSRIHRLAIPPAYDDVWICPLPNGHLQATGRDARGRKQYRYHADWQAVRKAHNFDRMSEFGHVLPRIRAKVQRDLLGAPGSRDAVLAALVRLLDTTLVRVGNEAYARSNRSYGLTTLLCRHVRVRGNRLNLRFRGKSGVWQEVAVDDPRVARIVRRCQALPGQDLFQYEDEAGQTRGLGSADVNGYLRAISGADFTAKDFRTWHASVHALQTLCQLPGDGPATAREVNEMLRDVAARLGNTPAVCRKSYVHPQVLEAAVRVEGRMRLKNKEARRVRGLSVGECGLLGFLQARTKPARTGPVSPRAGSGGEGGR